MIEVARNIYRRIAATGSDRTVALTRLAIFAEAQRAEDGKVNPVPNEETLQNLRRAWQRHERDINARRERGELILAFWGMVLMRSYPDEMLLADFSRMDLEEAATPVYRKAIAYKAEFEKALRSLYSLPSPARLAELPQLKGIGPRIGCLCMLSYVTKKNEMADFFIVRLDRWHKQNADPSVCRRDLIPQTQTRVPTQVVWRASSAEKKFKEAEDALRRADSKTLKQRQEEFEKTKKAHDEAQEELSEAHEKAANNSTRYREKAEAVREAAKVCYVDPLAPAPAAPTASPLRP